jgi:hypothetical protein
MDREIKVSMTILDDSQALEDPSLSDESKYAGLSVATKTTYGGLTTVGLSEMGGSVCTVPGSVLAVAVGFEAGPRVGQCMVSNLKWLFTLELILRSMIQ